MADWRSFWFEMAAKALPQAFFVAKGSCGGEVIVLAPGESLAREAAVRLWGKDSDGFWTEPEDFTVDKVPVILAPAEVVPHPTFGGGFDDVQVIGESFLFGDLAEIRRRLAEARDEDGPVYREPRYENRLRNAEIVTEQNERTIGTLRWLLREAADQLNGKPGKLNRDALLKRIAEEAGDAHDADPTAKAVS